MTRTICVSVLFGFFTRIILPHGMAICDVYEYTNRICPGFVVWREDHLPPSESIERIPFYAAILQPSRHNSSAALASFAVPTLLLSAMTSPLPPDFYGLPDFLSEFMMDINFSFDFGAGFSRFDESSNDSSGLYEYDGVSCDFSVEGYVARCRRCRRQRRRLNQQFRFESVLTSCWYINLSRANAQYDLRAVFVRKIW